MIREYLLRRAEKIIENRRPDFVVRAGDEPYMERWWVIPRNRFFNVYLHHFVHDDEDRALHDHPWVSMTYILSGGYREVQQSGVYNRWPGAVTFRRSTTAHRVVLFRRPNGDILEAISLFLTGPTVRVWGFHCSSGWVPWQKFVDSRDKGAVGQGCGET